MALAVTRAYADALSTNHQRNIDLRELNRRAHANDQTGRSNLQRSPPMTYYHSQAGLAVTLATGAGFVLLASAAFAADAVSSTDPGFDLATGQINRGFDPKVPSSSASPPQISSPAEARAAFSASKSAASTGLGGTGPIGATRQTMPEQFSKTNETLDRVPLMALPLGLSDQQRQRVFQAVMADKTAAATDAGNLALTSVLPTEVALKETHDFPSSLDDIARPHGLKYVKTKDKVFLIVPNNRIVIDEIPD